MSLFKKKPDEEPQEVRQEAVPGEELTGSAADVQAIMEKYDRESNVRHFKGVPKKVVRYLMAAFSLLMALCISAGSSQGYWL